MRWSFWYELRGPAKLWVASTVFIIIGALIAFVVPDVAKPTQDRDAVVLLLRLLGGAFIILGLAVFLPMLISVFIAAERREQWHWWINFIGGFLGALMFAVPATLMFPVFFIAYLTRPNTLVPNDAAAANNLGISALFSVIGLVVLTFLFFVGRKIVREKRNPIEWTYHKEN